MSAIPFDFGRGNARIQTIKGLLEDTKELASGTYRQAAAIVAGETVTIGADVFEAIEISTDSTDDTGGTADDFVGTADPLVVNMPATLYPVVGVGGSSALAVGDMVRLATEIMRVSQINGDNITFLRGQSDTTNATHADAVDILVMDTAITAGTTIVVGIDGTVFTAAAWTDKLIADNNEHTTENVRMIDIDDDTILAVASAPGAIAIATTETATAAWDAATLVGGAASARRPLTLITRVPTDAEVTLGLIHIPVAFDPTSVIPYVVVTASGIEKRIIIAAGDVQPWDGAITITAAAAGNPAFVTLDNAGVGADWAATDTIHLLVTG